VRLYWALALWAQKARERASRRKRLRDGQDLGNLMVQGTRAGWNDRIGQLRKRYPRMRDPLSKKIPLQSIYAYGVNDNALVRLS
jgi:hypothetical protein